MHFLKYAMQKITKTTKIAMHVFRYFLREIQKIRYFNIHLCCLMYVTCIYCVCCAYSLCILYITCILCVCYVYFLCMLRVIFVYVTRILCVRRYVYSLCMLRVFFVYVTCILCVLRVLFVYVMCILCVERIKRLFLQ